MMVFVLLGVYHNKLNNVISKIKSLGPRHLNKVHLVYGEYDVIAEIKATSPEISADILRNLKETEGVNTFKTYVVSDQLTDEGELKAMLSPEPW